MKNARVKVLALLGLTLLIEIAVFGYLYLGEAREQDCLREELSAANSALSGLPVTDYEYEADMRNRELKTAITDAINAGVLLAGLLEPTVIYEKLFSLAGYTDVSVVSITSPGKSIKKINAYSLDVLPLDLKILGTVDEINNFTAALSGGFRTVAIDSIHINMNSADGMPETSAELHIDIYCYRGGPDE